MAFFLIADTPLPGEFWQRWNLDPILIVLLLLPLGAYLSAVRGGGGPRSAGRANFVSGWLVGAAALISPVMCAVGLAVQCPSGSAHDSCSGGRSARLLGHPGSAYSRLSPALAYWISNRRLTRSAQAPRVRP